MSITEAVAVTRNGPIREPRRETQLIEEELKEIWRKFESSVRQKTDRYRRREDVKTTGTLSAF